MSAIYELGLSVSVACLHFFKMSLSAYVSYLRSFKMALSVSGACLPSQNSTVSMSVACLQTRCRQRLSADKTVCVRVTLIASVRD